MINIKRNIANKSFSLNIEDGLIEQAEALLDIISNIEATKLKNKFKIQVGWNIFIIVEDAQGYKVVAPDYMKNPFSEITNDLTISLWIQFEQCEILNKLKLVGETISFKDKVVCAKGVLSLDNIYLERRKVYETGDSGWYIGPVDDEINTDELEAYYAYQLLKIRASIIKALGLPTGYMAVLDKNGLKAVLDENDIDIL